MNMPTTPDLPVQKLITTRSKIASSIAKSERRESDRTNNNVPRALCDRCSRPPAICLCSGLPLDGPISIPNTQVLILQHPNEFRRRKSISTTPLLPLVLERCSINVGYRFEIQDLAPVREALSSGQRPLLLFPGKDAISLDDKNEASVLVHDPKLLEDDYDYDYDEPSSQRLLILLDGTWSQAKNMARESPLLVEACQKVQFTKSGESVYGTIRTQPADYCLSTLECCAQAMLYLEPNNDQVRLAALHLKNVLQTLVDQQQQMKRVGHDHRDGNGGEGYNSGRIDHHDEAALDDNRDSLLEKKKGDAEVVVRLAGGSTLRRLRHSDASLVHSQWDDHCGGSTRTSSSSSSLEVLKRRIAKGDACFGIFHGRDLCGFILQYDDATDTGNDNANDNDNDNDKNSAPGIIMLRVPEACRRRGYASTLVRKATQTLRSLERVSRVAHILDSNTASKAIFSQQGWVQQEDKEEDLTDNNKRGTDLRRAKRKWILGGGTPAAATRGNRRPRSPSRTSD